MYFTSNDGSQEKIDKDTDYILSWKSNGVYNSKLQSLYTAFLYSITLSGYKMGIKFHKDSVAVEQNNYLTKIVNVCIIYDIIYDLWFMIMILIILSNLRIAYL